MGKAILKEKGTSFPSRPPAKELSIVRYYGPVKIIDGQIVEDHGPQFVILHRDTGRVLCQAGEREYTDGECGILFYPLKFTYQNAAKWVKSGYIGELQESYTNLQIGFVKSFWEKA